MKRYDVAIIGAGTAGLSARKQIAKKTDNYVIIDSGPLGTTCARVGCMPSKVFIQAANDFHRRLSLEKMGIENGDELKLNQEKLLNHVRSLRDRFVNSVVSSHDEFKDKLIKKRAKFIDAHTLDLEGELIQADKVIIATGSSPIIPAPWQKFKDKLIDTNFFFEQDRLPNSMAVIGLGVIGLELGQALNRLGVKVLGADLGRNIGGLTDPEIQDYVIDKFSKEFPIYNNGANIIGETDKGLLKIEVDDQVIEVEKALISVGRKPNTNNLGLENLGIDVSKGPKFSSHDYTLTGHPHIFFVGDVNNERPILHEAADEGIIAGINAVADTPQCFQRRTAMGIVFSDPNIAFVGERYKDLLARDSKFITGRVSFEGQGRSIVKLKEQGLLKVYADKRSGKILGSEMQAPDAEHLAHLLAWGITQELTVSQMLKMPFYHPVIEEGLRTALRDAQSQLQNEQSLELLRCHESLY